MYSGTTFRTKSGRIAGVHQKIDRLAYRLLQKNLPKSQFFPILPNILHFEGKNGPDGIKLKSPSQDELKHFIDPMDVNESELLTIIDDHIYNLALALKTKDQIKSAFEASWLAHAVVDGLTPAHHYPNSNHSRKKPLKFNKNIESDEEVKAEVKKYQALIKKWEYWGAKGLMNHMTFEWGVASVVSSRRFKLKPISKKSQKKLLDNDFRTWFIQSLAQIHELRMYEEFCESGWTLKLAKTTTDILIPVIIEAVEVAWHQAIILSE